MFRSFPPWSVAVSLAVALATVLSSPPRVLSQAQGQGEVALQPGDHLALGVHGGVFLLPSSCLAVADVVSCRGDLDLHRGFDISGLIRLDGGLSVGGRVALGWGLDTGEDDVRRTRWMMRLSAELRADRDFDESGRGPYLLGALGALLLVDQVHGSVLNDSGALVAAEESDYMPAAPLVGAAVGYDFQIYQRLLLGVLLRAEAAYLFGDGEVGYSRTASGPLALIELSLRLSMSRPR